MYIKKSHTHAMKKIFLIFVVLISLGCASKDSVPAPAQSLNENSESKILEAGVIELQKGNSSRAIDKYFDVVIKSFEAKYNNSSNRIYCARTREESLLYLLNAANEKRDISVISALWSDAYYLKSYANIDLGRIEDAKASINNAINLSPSNAQYLSELGNMYQVERNWNDAITVFKQAEEAAKATSPADVKTAELLRAKRGIAYSLVELGKLSEAEVIYKECLSIDSNDKKSQQELEYIKRLRAGKIVDGVEVN